MTKTASENRIQPQRLYDRKNDSRLVAIESNRVAEPEDKIILMTEQPWVSIQGEGKFSGQYFCFIRVSYCPLSCSFCDIKASWTDKNKKGQTIREISDWAADKYPDRVCLTGGEPMFKYDDEIVHLVSSLHEKNKKVHFETSGICVPEILSGQLDSWLAEGIADDNILPDWVCISPKYRDCVPKEEEGQYLVYMISQMKFWKEAMYEGLIDGEWKFVISADNTEEDLIQAIWILTEIFDKPEDFDGVRITFQPETREEIYNTPLGQRTPDSYFRYLKDWANLTKEVGRILPNLHGADVHIMSQSHQLLNYL